MIDPTQSYAMRRLWCYVLESALRDLNGRQVSGVSSGRLQKHQAAMWIGSRDYKMVCTLAGIDPDAAEPAIRDRIASGERFNLARDMP